MKSLTPHWLHKYTQNEMLYLHVINFIPDVENSELNEINDCQI